MTVFISHSSHDHAAVRSLIQHLQTGHESVWLDQSLIGGDAWWQRILHQIRSCTVFVVALSNSCLQSKPCRAEIDYAKALGLPILPVIIGDVDSYRIDPIFTVQSVDFRTPDAASAAALIAAVRERAAERKELPDPLPESPPVPYEYLQRLGVAIDSPEELSPTEQTTILADLRHALRQEDDESVREDIRRLLGALRRRSEVTHGNVEEIDDLLGRYPAARGDAAAPPEGQSEAAHTAKATTPEVESPAMLVGESGTSDRSASTKSRLSRWNPKAVAIAAGAGVLIAIIGVVAYLLFGRTSPGPTANKPATSASQASPSVSMAALNGLLLRPDQFDAAVGATQMHIVSTVEVMGTTPTSEISPPRCMGVWSGAQAESYANSGYVGVRGNELEDFQPQQGQQGQNLVPGNHEAHQNLVAFPTAAQAAAFYSGSAQSWQGCSTFTHTTTGAVWTIGPVTNVNGTLAATITQQGADGWACQRALTVENNVVIDITVCSFAPDEQAVNVAHQIATKVAKP
jgi:serine/threonine kinase PknH